MIALSFLRANGRWLAAGFLLALSSSFGQTFFISLFSGELRAELGLSHGQFGGIYTAATLASAATLIWFGRLADRLPVVRIGVITLLGLALTALAMANVGSAIMLLVVLYGLRLFGQGMLFHIAMTAMARWFTAFRGRAISIAALGMPAGEALFPILAVALAAAIGWRQAWFAASLSLLLVAVPLVLWLLRGTLRPSEERFYGSRDHRRTAPRRHWSRAEVLRDATFYALMPGILAPSFIMTGIFFHQVHLVETKAWTLAWFAASYPIYAASTLVVSLAAGWAVDQWGAARLLPFYLLPMSAGVLVLASVNAPVAMAVFMLLSGCTAGAASTVLGALWVELYGTQHLGGIRALITAGMVFSSALAPGAMGWLIDLGVGLEVQFLGMVAYALVGTMFFFLLSARLKTLTAV